MNEKKKTWEGPERRSGKAPAPVPGELSPDRLWRPTEEPLGVSDGWLRANGYAPDRRKGQP